MITGLGDEDVTSCGIKAAVFSSGGTRNSAGTANNGVALSFEAAILGSSVWREFLESSLKLTVRLRNAVYLVPGMTSCPRADALSTSAKAIHATTASLNAWDMT